MIIGYQNNRIILTGIRVTTARWCHEIIAGILHLCRRLWLLFLLRSFRGGTTGTTPADQLCCKGVKDFMVCGEEISTGHGKINAGFPLCQCIVS
jgi:hypothetical protein